MESGKVKEIKNNIIICSNKIECKGCSLFPNMKSTNCRNKLLADALTLISELESENKRLNEAINSVQKGFDNGEFISKDCQTRTLKQFVVKAKERCHNYYPSIDHYCCSEKAVSVKDIDELLKKYEK